MEQSDLMKPIFNRLQEIADLTFSMVKVGTANCDNESFVKLMGRHRNFTAEENCILDEME